MKNAYKKLIISAKGSNTSFCGFLYLLFPQKTSNYFSIGLNLFKDIASKGMRCLLICICEWQRISLGCTYFYYMVNVIFILDDFNQSPFQYQGILL